MKTKQHLPTEKQFTAQVIQFGGEARMIGIPTRRRASKKCGPSERYQRSPALTTNHPRVNEGTSMATPQSTRLSVVGKGSKSGYLVYLCTCGTRKEIRSAHVRQGKILSCGCLNQELRIERATTHGHYGTPENRTWRGMLNRCYNRRASDYARYGGRGITVCDRWRNSFETFLADMCERPSPSHSIDRYPDNDGNYEPGNCRWATLSEQGRNKRSNFVIEIDGVPRTATEWAELSGLKYETILRRVKAGWDPRRAVTEPAFRGRWKS